MYSCANQIEYFCGLVFILVISQQQENCATSDTTKKNLTPTQASGGTEIYLNINCIYHLQCYCLSKKQVTDQQKIH